RRGSQPQAVGQLGGRLELGRRQRRLREVAGLLAVLPPHAAPADLVVGEPAVEGDRAGEQLEDDRPAQVEARAGEARDELEQHLRLRAYLAGSADRLADALEPPVRVRDRAVLLGVRL